MIAATREVEPPATRFRIFHVANLRHPKKWLCNAAKQLSANAACRGIARFARYANLAPFTMQKDQDSLQPATHTVRLKIM
jgi:hypothetical protein